MSIAGCVLNVKPTVKKRPSKPVYFNVKRKPARTDPSPARGLVQRLRSLTSGATSNVHRRPEPHDSHAVSAPASDSSIVMQHSILSEQPVALLLGTRKTKQPTRPKPIPRAKIRPKPKPKPKRKVANVGAKADKPAPIDDEQARQEQEMFQKRTQERVMFALRAKKKELQKAQQRREVETNNSGPDPAILVKKVRGCCWGYGCGRLGSPGAVYVYTVGGRARRFGWCKSLSRNLGVKVCGVTVFVVRSVRVDRAHEFPLRVPSSSF